MQGKQGMEIKFSGNVLPTLFYLCIILQPGNDPDFYKNIYLTLNTCVALHVVIV